MLFSIKNRRTFIASEVVCINNYKNIVKRFKRQVDASSILLIK